MRIHKILALMYVDFLIFRELKWKIVEFIYFPVVTVLIWGLFSVYTQEIAMQTGLIVLAVNIFWSYGELAQKVTNIQMMEDLWSGSIRQIILSGITEFEYIIARIFSAIWVSLSIMAVMLLLGMAFGLSILFINTFSLVSLMMITLISSIALSILIASLILYLGRDYGFLSWTLISVFVFLSAPFYPVSIYPEAIRWLVSIMPYTSVFEGIRQIIQTSAVSNSLLITGAILALAYLIISIPIYRYVFRKIRKTGEILKFK